MQTPPPSARSYTRRSALLARRAASGASEAVAQERPLLEVAAMVATYQAAAALLAQNSIAQALAEQAIDEAAQALLNITAFTTPATTFEGMVGAIEDRRDLRFAVVEPTEYRTEAQFEAEFERLVASLVQDAGRAAQSVATTVRHDIRHVRMLTPPSCSRCVVLARRIYRYSDGFRRHPNCDCVMIPTTVASPLVADPQELIRQGMVTGLSKADLRAVADGADLNQVVNIRKLTSSLQQSGRVLARRGRLTPEGIYRQARTQDEAIELLAKSGYLL